MVIANVLNTILPLYACREREREGKEGECTELCKACLGG